MFRASPREAAAAASHAASPRLEPPLRFCFSCATAAAFPMFLIGLPLVICVSSAKQYGVGRVPQDHASTSSLPGLWSPPILGSLLGRYLTFLSLKVLIYKAGWL